jgi:CTD small phosphatase-like protein 2
MSFVKDLSKLGRDMNKIIIIDNLPDNFKQQPNNGLGIRTWQDDIKDRELYDIAKILKGKKNLKNRYLRK